MQGFLLNTVKCHKSYYCSRCLVMPCDIISQTGTQVANHSWSLALTKSWTGSPKISRLHKPGAGGRPTHAQWANEQSNIITIETDNQQDRPQTEALTTRRQGNPWSRVTFARNMESSPQWRFLRFTVARRGRCHSRISSGRAKRKSRVLSLPSVYITNISFCKLPVTSADKCGELWEPWVSRKFDELFIIN